MWDSSLNRTCYFLDVILGILIFSVPAGAIVEIRSGEENAVLFNDRFPTSPHIWSPIVLGAGDFNGDGRDDVAVDLPRSDNGEISLFFSGNPGKTLFSTDENLRVLTNRAVFDAHSLAFADLDGDGKKELVIGISQRDVSNNRGEIHIIRGSTAPLSVINLITGRGDLLILGKPSSLLGASVTVGHFNEDSREDLLIAAPGVGECYLVFGGSVPLAGTLDLSGPHPLPVIRGSGGVGGFITNGDFDGDGWDDLILSAPNADTAGRTDNGEIHILFGGGSFPPLWTLGSPPADVRVWGAGNTARIAGTGAGDLTGDGRDELLIQRTHGSDAVAIILAGSDIAAGGILDLSTTSANAVASYPILDPSYTMTGKAEFGDFDGDGKADLFVMNNRGSSRIVFAMLSTDDAPGGVDLNALHARSLAWEGNFMDIVLADLNGDRFRDLMVFDDFGVPYQPPYGAVKTVYGFEPLRNPTVNIAPRSPPSPRVKLALAVGGDPREMKLSGDVTDAFRDQWIPFHSDPEITFTSEEGTKNVRAVFRNSVGRESEMAEDSLVLASGDPGVVTGTNRLRPGAKAVFDCHVKETTRLRARIFDGHGEEVRALLDLTVEPGIVPVVWDGADIGGGRVDPGVYFLVLELRGERITKKILVE
ncbi:MAG: FG-GAP repeat protein [Elusimicrobia bacterium]|nr:FG-GAP repeat protein [Elusimicrobiota bacterium]